MYRKRSIKDEGFTVVELIVTIVVCAILVIAVNSVVVSHVFIVQKGRDAAISNAFSEAKIESLRSGGYLSLNNGTVNITSELPDELSAPRSANLAISDHSPGMKQINLVITYNEQGTARTSTYQTLIGELGAGQN